MNRLNIFIIGTVLLAAAPVAAQEQTGEELFLKYCKACHGTDGKADTPMGKRLNIRDYTKPEVQAEFSDERIAQVIKEGIVNESGRKVMLPFENKITPEETQTLVAYIRSLAE